MCSTRAARCSCVVTSSSQTSTRVFDAFWRDTESVCRALRDASQRTTGRRARRSRLPRASRAIPMQAARTPTSDRRRRRADVERRARTGAQGLRRVHRRGNGAGARGARRVSRGYPAQRRTRRWVRGPGPAHRSAARARAQPPHAAAMSSRCPAAADASGRAAGAALRRQRLDGALLAHAAALRARHRRSGISRVEVFLFSTSLTRVTRHLRARRTARPLRPCLESVPDWSGGTRIGDALQQFHQRWARRVMTAGPVVLLISDGWDRGDPHVLRAPDRPPAAQLPPPDLAQSAHRHGRLRAADARAAGGAALRGRLPAGPDARPISATSRYTWNGGVARQDRRAPHHVMDISGTYTFPAPPERVWELLMDPAVIASCIPGCESFEPDGENRYRAHSPWRWRQSPAPTTAPSS